MVLTELQLPPGQVLTKEPEGKGLEPETTGGSGGSGNNTEEGSLNPEDERAKTTTEQFIAFWTTRVPEDIILETPVWIRDMAISRSPDSFRSLLHSLHRGDADFTAWHREQRETFYRLFSITTLTQEAKDFVQRVYDGCLIAGNAPPSTYVPVASFGIDLSQGRFGPFEFLRSIPVNQIDIEQNLISDHQELLNNELPPVWFNHQAEEYYRTDWQTALVKV